MTWEQVLEEKVKAEESVRQTCENTKSFMKEVQGGMKLAVAKRIIEKIWGMGVQGRNMVAQLSASFPERNVEVIRYETLPKEAIPKLVGHVDPCLSFYKVAFEYINEMIKEILEVCSRADANDQLAQRHFNEIRKNVLKYVDIVLYDSVNFATIQAANKWADLNLSSIRVDDGDYMFMTDFQADVGRAQDDVLHRLHSYGDGWKAISSIEYQEEDHLHQIKLVYLFAEYLHNLVNPPAAE